MLLLAGTYKFNKKRLAYRNDFCTFCDTPKLAIKVSSFWVVHVFFVPLIPLGKETKWLCINCHNDPHGKSKLAASPVLPAFSGLLCLGASILYWRTPLDGSNNDSVWAFRIILSIIGFLLLLWAFRSKRDPSLESNLSMVPPAPLTICSICGGPLSPSTPLRCPVCAIDREQL